MYNMTIEQSVMGYAIRYNVLKNLVSECFKNTIYANSNKVNIFIDITKMIKSINSNDLTSICNDKLALSANLLNLCAHYKSFFNRGYGVDASVYLIRTNGVMNLNKLNIPKYSPLDNNEKMVFSGDISKNLDLISIMVPYLHNIDYIVTNEEISNVLFDIDENYGDKNTPNILITKDIYTSTIASTGNFFVFRPRKNNGDDTSYSITSKNIFDAYQRNRKVKPVDCSGINPAFIGFIMSYTRVQERNVNNVYNFSTIINALKKALADGVILNQYVFDPMFTAETLNKYLARKADPYTVSLYYKALDMYQVYNAYKYSRTKYKGMVNLSDINKINEISEKYYNITKVDFPTLLV